MKNDVDDRSGSIEALLAKDAIREALYRYCRAIDRCDRELLQSVYWPDSIDNHGIFNGNAYLFCDFIIPLMSTMDRSMHHLTNIAIDLDGVDSAKGETYFLALHELNDGGKMMEHIVGGRYLDRFERRNGDWRIKERLVVLDWTQERASAANWGPDSAVGSIIHGARRPDDPSYSS